MSSISGGSGAKNFITDAGTAVAVNSTISVVGAGGATTSAAGNVITVTSGGGGITTINGDSGSVTGATVTLTTNELANTTVQFTGSGTTMSLSFSDSNLNLIIGEAGSASTLTSATATVGLGYTAFNKLQSGDNNTGIGYAAFHELISGSSNCGFGQQPLYFLTSGSFNTAIGAYQTGINYTGSESSNLLLQHPGVLGESNTMRLGESGSGDHQVNRAFIAGVAGVSVSNTQMMTIDSSTGQMGSATIPSGSGIATINGDTGSATGAAVTFTMVTALETSNATPSFSATGSTVSLDLGDANDNLILSTTLGASTITSAGGNTGYGNGAFASVISGNYNSGFGLNPLQSLTTGSSNSCVGQQNLLFLVSGSYNFAAGYQAGINYNGSESSNVLIQNLGVVGESNTMRIGETGSGDHQVNKCFIAAVRGVTTGNADALPVLVDSAGQFGTVSSSARYKDNIAPMADTNVMALTPVNFTYKSDKTNKQQYGLIAEEVAELFPDLAVYNAEGAPESVHYEKLPAILLHELQKQNKRIAALEAQLAAK